MEGPDATPAQPVEGMPLAHPRLRDEAAVVSELPSDIVEPQHRLPELDIALRAHVDTIAVAG